MPPQNPGDPPSRDGATTIPNPPSDASAPGGVRPEAGSAETWARSTVADQRPGYGPADTPPAVVSGLDDEVSTQGWASSFDRYAAKELLGEGGMGEVRLWKDQRIGRDIALKVIRQVRGARADLRLRFLREARVQGQLEHPSVVPVYDLGTTPDGAPFFTMKRVRGRTLEEIFVKDADPLASRREDTSRNRLLSAFHSVCMAIDFAHARGVVHRDLKPGNVMLGGFGEVYVLDWGLAKISGTTDPRTEAVEVPHTTSGTAAGAVMGTPGYMAPEQLASPDVRPSADVYALGAILFEILAREPLHVGKTVEMLAASTVKGADARAGKRAPHLDVPPELEAICIQATAQDPDARPTANQIATAIERYLDGDRDVERRRAMSKEHVVTAQQEARVALAGGADAVNARTRAIREIGRALALDPRNPGALYLLARLISEPPTEIPPEAQKALDAATDQRLRDTASGGWLAYLSFPVYGALFIVMGFRDVPLAALGVACVLGAAFVARSISRSTSRPRASSILLLLLTSLAIGISTRSQSPFILAPAMASANLMTFGLVGERSQRYVAIFCNLAAVFVPIGLELLGVVTPSFGFEGKNLEIYPHIVSFERHGVTLAYMAITTFAIILSPVLLLTWTRERLARYERDEIVRAWHFRKLLPNDDLESGADGGDDAARRRHDAL